MVQIEAATDAVEQIVQAEETECEHQIIEESEQTVISLVQEELFVAAQTQVPHTEAFLNCYTY